MLLHSVCLCSLPAMPRYYLGKQPGAGDVDLLGQDKAAALFALPQFLVYVGAALDNPPAPELLLAYAGKAPRTFKPDTKSNLTNFDNPYTASWLEDTWRWAVCVCVC